MSPQPPNEAQDFAGHGYWESLWADRALATPVDPADDARDNEVVRRLDQQFQRTFGSMPAGSRLIEIGCANSGWLPYFASRFAFSVVGIDYSRAGCVQATAVLERAGLEREIVCADFFDPPPHLEGAFDALVSFGVVEHFDDTVACLRAFARYLQPGGVAFTVIPNMRGLGGFVQHMANREVFDIHIALSPQELQAAHEHAGFHVRSSEHFLSTNFGVLNLNGLRLSAPSTRMKAWAFTQLVRVSKAIWALEARAGPLPTTRLFSPYIVCVAEKRT